MKLEVKYLSLRNDLETIQYFPKTLINMGRDLLLADIRNKETSAGNVAQSVKQIISYPYYPEFQYIHKF